MTEKISLTGPADWLVIAGLGLIWALIPGIHLAAVTSWFYSTTVDLMLSNPFSRVMETEADEVNLNRPCLLPLRVARVHSSAIQVSWMLSELRIHCLSQTISIHL